LKKLAIIAAALLLCGCEKIPLLGSAAHGSEAAGPQIPRPSVANVAYASDDVFGHRLDIYLPQSGTTPYPVVMITRGSGWMRNDGKELSFEDHGVRHVWADGVELVRRLNASGYAVVAVSVRSSGEAIFPAQIHDAKAAVRWVRNHARDHNLDGAHIGYFGDSSAGWTALMTALTNGVEELEGDIGDTSGSSDVQAVAAFSAATDFSQMDDWSLEKCDPSLAVGVGGSSVCRSREDSTVSRLVGCPINDCPDRVQAANPIRHITDDDPPVFLMHGQSDRSVPHHQSELLYQALNKSCHDVTLVSLPLGRHRGLAEQQDKLDGATIRSTSAADCRGSGLTLVTPTWDLVITFFDNHLKTGTS
jgi:acetyl esterase/lipase